MELYKIKSGIKTINNSFTHYYTRELTMDNELELNYEVVNLDVMLISFNNGNIVYKGNLIYIDDHDLIEEIKNKLLVD